MITNTLTNSSLTAKIGYKLDKKLVEAYSFLLREVKQWEILDAGNSELVRFVIQSSSSQHGLVQTMWWWTVDLKAGPHLSFNS